MKIVKKVSFGVAVMSIAVHLSAQVLSVDFETNVVDLTQSGFTQMVVLDQTTLVTTKIIGSYTVKIAGGYSNTCFSGGPVVAYNGRTRTNNIGNAGAFTQANLMRERIVAYGPTPVDPAVGLGTGPGLYIMVEGLAPNQTYSIRVWGVDHSGKQKPLKSGYAYGFNATFETNGYTSLPQLGNYTVTNSPTTIADNNQYSVSGNITSDYQGRIIYKSIANIDGCGIANGFTLTMVGAPAEGYQAWGNGWGVNIGTGTNDYDGDGVNNFYEYAFNGNPTNSMDSGTEPKIIEAGDTLQYVHLLRYDNPNLTYTLQVKTNLMSGSWSSVQYPSDAYLIGGDYDEIRHTLPNVERNYLRLLVEEQ